MKLLFKTIIIFLSLSACTFVNGQDNESADFVVAPSHKEVRVVPGVPTTFTISVKNRTGRDADFAIGVEDLENVSDKFSLKSYISLATPNIRLSNNERFDLSITVLIPVFMGTGFYGAVTIATDTGGVGGSGVAHLSSRIAVPIFVRPAAEVDLSGRLVNFTLASGRGVLTKSPVNFIITYENTGDYHIAPVGKIILKNIFGQTISVDDISPWFILPHSERSTTVEVGRGEMFGKYNAEIIVSEGMSKNIQSRELTFWVLPWKLLFFAIGSLVVILFLIKIRRSYLMFLVFGLLIFSARTTYATVASSTNYILERDSINFAGGRSTSTNYIDEDTVGESATGRATSTNFALEAGYQQSDGYISITSPADVTLSPAIASLGGGAANASAPWTVKTDNPSGYTLYIKAATSPALKSSGGSFGDYTPTSGIPDFTWSVSSASSEFGFSPSGSDIATRYKDSGTSCSTGSLDTSSSCWDGLSTTNKIISNTTSANQSGSLTTVYFKAEAGSATTQSIGSYSALITVTATAL